MTPPDIDPFVFNESSQEPEKIENAHVSQKPLPDSLTLLPGVHISSRLEKVKAAQNPLLEAAKPLLLAIAQTPKDLPDAASAAAWRELLIREVNAFSQICSRINIRREHAVTASFCLTTALDEAANSTRWGGTYDIEQAGIWAKQQLASHFHNDTQGGKKFFLLIGRLSTHAEEHLDLLELMYYILGLGFQGQYSAITNGPRELEAIRHRLLALISAARGAGPRELSLHWRGETPGKNRFWRDIPVWINVCLFGLAVFALFCWHKYHLLEQSAFVEEKIAAIGKLTPPPVRALRLSELLREEIAQGKVFVEEDDFHSAVTLRGDDMFTSGRVQVNSGILPLLDRVAVEIGKVSGAVRIIGHTDNIPVRGGRFPDNQALSKARADHVAKELEARGVLPTRIETLGKADSEPLADNATAAGRARNRRVQIVVQQFPGAVLPMAAPR
ncbi:MAG: type VI secretion system protein TssL, long form [Candidatus Accumulibacter sp.]|jgi:type VI secretion system protein ImpK|nr:type VI secretion system protein TssL, long form [Accumulibacter sp.]